MKPGITEFHAEYKLVIQSREALHQSHMKMVDYARETTKEVLVDKAIFQGIDFRYTVEETPGKV